MYLQGHIQHDVTGYGYLEPLGILTCIANARIGSANRSFRHLLLARHIGNTCRYRCSYSFEVSSASVQYLPPKMDKAIH
jgi:hypothetical protein